MRKIFDQKFWSHGTPLGSLRPLSWEAVILGAVRLQIPVIWGPYEPPELVPLNVQPENPNTTASWCGVCLSLRNSVPIYESLQYAVYCVLEWVENNEGSIGVSIACFFTLFLSTAVY